jgi:hypothetical protein
MNCALKLVNEISQLFIKAIYECAWLAQSVERRATGWTVRESNPGGGEIFSARPERL